MGLFSKKAFAKRVAIDSNGHTRGRNEDDRPAALRVRAERLVERSQAGLAELSRQFRRPVWRRGQLVIVVEKQHRGRIQPRSRAWRASHRASALRRAG